MVALRLALVAVCGTWACAIDDGRTASDADTHVQNVGLTELETDTGDLETDASDPSICLALPSTGLCAHLCDAEGLGELVAPGTCAAIICTLTDGREVTAHACHP